MTRRTRPNKERRALASQGRDARRARFRNLIDRAGRLPLTPQEADALRGAAEAEIAEADHLRATVGGQQSAMRRLSEQLDAAHEAIREAEQAAADAGEQLRAHRAAEEQRRMRARVLSAEEQRPLPGQLITHHNLRAAFAEYLAATEERARTPAPVRPTASAPEHTDGNAEDCDACRQASPLPYPWICPATSTPEQQP